MVKVFEVTNLWDLNFDLWSDSAGCWDYCAMVNTSGNNIYNTCFITLACIQQLHQAFIQCMYTLEPTLPPQFAHNVMFSTWHQTHTVTHPCSPTAAVGSFASLNSLTLELLTIGLTIQLYILFLYMYYYTSLILRPEGNEASITHKLSVVCTLHIWNIDNKLELQGHIVCREYYTLVIVVNCSQGL